MLGFCISILILLYYYYIYIFIFLFFFLGGGGGGGRGGVRAQGRIIHSASEAGCPQGVEVQKHNLFGFRVSEFRVQGLGVNPKTLNPKP